MNKQIEEMTILARVFCQTIEDGGCCEKCSKCGAYRMAEKFYNAGYRKSTDVAREIFEEIESKKIFLKDHAGNMGVVVRLKDIAELKKKYESEGAE